MGDVVLGDGDHQAEVGLDQPALGHGGIPLHPSEQVDGFSPSPGTMAPAEGLPSDALEPETLLRIELVLPDTDHRIHHPEESLAVHPAGDGDGGEEIPCKLPRLDAHGQVDLLGSCEEWNPSDLLQVHPDGVESWSLEQLLATATASAVGFAAIVVVIAGDVDDIDPLVPEHLLHVDEEFLDLLGG